MDAVDAFLAAPVPARGTYPLPEPTSFWCGLCHSETPTADSRGLSTAPTDGPTCALCGEEFTCHDCGAVIERDGDCEARRTGQHR